VGGLVFEVPVISSATRLRERMTGGYAIPAIFRVADDTPTVMAGWKSKYVPSWTEVLFSSA
jgi:hypothetical protein